MILFAYHAQVDRFPPKYIGFTIIFNVNTTSLALNIQ